MITDKEPTKSSNGNSYYIVRSSGVGDTILGDGAHKIMYAMNRAEKAHNSSSVYKFSTTDKIKFIEKFAEEILEGRGVWS